MKRIRWTSRDRLCAQRRFWRPPLFWCDALSWVLVIGGVSAHSRRICRRALLRVLARHFRHVAMVEGPLVSDKWL